LIHFIFITFKDRREEGAFGIGRTIKRIIRKIRKINSLYLYIVTYYLTIGWI